MFKFKVFVVGCGWGRNMLMGPKWGLFSKRSLEIGPIGPKGPLRPGFGSDARGQGIKKSLERIILSLVVR